MEIVNARKIKAGIVPKARRESNSLAQNAVIIGITEQYDGAPEANSVDVEMANASSEVPSQWLVRPN